jgi:hypothetical protein
MKEIKELALEIANNFGKMKLIEIIYKDGESITGNVHKVPEDPMNIILQKRIVKHGENAIHRIDFDRLQKVKITYKEQPTKIFE